MSNDKTAATGYQPFGPQPKPAKKGKGRFLWPAGVVLAFLAGTGVGSANEEPPRTVAVPGPTVTTQVAVPGPVRTVEVPAAPAAPDNSTDGATLMELTWAQQSADEQALMCTGYGLDPDSMWESFSIGMGDDYVTRQDFDTFFDKTC